MLHLLKAIYALLLPLTFFFPRISVPLLMFITILTVFITWKQRAHFSVRQRLDKKTLLCGLPVILFFVWSAISCFWSPYPLQSLSSLLAFLGLVLISIAYVFAFLNLDYKIQKQLICALLIGSFVTAMIMLIDSFFSSPWSAYKGVYKEKSYAKVSMGISFVGLIGWHFIKRLSSRIVFSILVSVALLYSTCDAAILAYFSGLCLYLLASISKLKKPIKILTTVFVPICFLLLPLMLSKSGMNREVALLWNRTGFLTHYSTLHRLVILSDTAKTIEQKPFIGHGYNTSKFDKVNGGEKVFTLIDFSGPDKPVIHSKYKMEHPHNFIMQLWLELGFMGVVLWLTLTLMVLNIMTSNLNRYRLGFSLFLCAHIHLLVSIGMWQSWWWALIAIITPCALYQKQKNHSQKNICCKIIPIII